MKRITFGLIGLLAVLGVAGYAGWTGGYSAGVAAGADGAGSAFLPYAVEGSFFFGIGLLFKLMFLAFIFFVIAKGFMFRRWMRSGAHAEGGWGGRWHGGPGGAHEGHRGHGKHRGHDHPHVEEPDTEKDADAEKA